MLLQSLLQVNWLLGISPTSFDAFVGASSGEDLADMSTKAGNGNYSFINRRRYYSTYTAENIIQIGFPEMCFNIAEAIIRGWTSGNAEDWYKKRRSGFYWFLWNCQRNQQRVFQKPGGT